MLNRPRIRLRLASLMTTATRVRAVLAGVRGRFTPSSSLAGAALPACLVTSTLIAALPAAAVAAELRREVATIEVSGESGVLTQPWTGGLVAPRPKLDDLDGDGDLDLLIVQGGGGLTYYRNDGTPEAHAFHWVADGWQGVDANTWATLADIDADGDLDLFTDSIGAVSFHRNDGDATDPRWVLEDTTFQDIVNTGAGNTPSFIDVDDDGDLDYLEMEQLFGTAQLYRNDGDATRPDFVFVTSAYGCIDTFDPPAAARPGAGKPPAAVAGSQPLAAAGSRHGISVIGAADLDADADVDILIGDFFSTNLWFFRNDDPSDPCYTRVTNRYLPIDTSGLNQPEPADLDADGDLDLLIGVTNSTAALDNLIYLENTGTPGMPSYDVVTYNLIEALDVGRESRPALGDLDGDGDLDLLIGGDDGTILQLRNTGSPSDPRYVIESTLTDASGAPIDVGARAAPELVDYDGDLDLDLFVGSGVGQVLYYRNDGEPDRPELHLADDAFAGAAADFNAVPALGDLDTDGDLDLLVGEFGTTANPRLFYLRNDGSIGEPFWVLVSDNTASTSIFAERVFTGSLAPELVDWDRDGDLDLLLGEADGDLNLYRNDGSPSEFAFVLIDERLAGTGIGQFTGPEVGDLDDDGDGDLLVGERNGGINVFRNLEMVPVTLVAFEVVDGGDLVELRWETGTERDHLGFDVRRAVVGSAADRTALEQLEGERVNQALVTGRSPYHWVDHDVVIGVTYAYWLEDVDRAGARHRHPARLLTVGETAPAAPGPRLAIGAVAPRPLRESTTVRFELPAAAAVELRLVGVDGRLVRRLIDGGLPAGRHRIDWDGRDGAGRQVPAGTYFIELRSGAEVARQKLLVIR